MQSFKSRTPASEEQITEAEQLLGLSFSQEYSDYLAEFGSASIYGHEFTGVCKSARLNVVHVTKAQREFNPDIPLNWYVIEETNVDGITIWQDSDGSIYFKSPNKLAKCIASSFLEYLK